MAETRDPKFVLPVTRSPEKRSKVHSDDGNNSNVMSADILVETSGQN